MTTPTTDEILSGEVRFRRDDFRLDLLDPTGALLGQLPYDEDQAPTITWDATARLQRVMRSLVLPHGTYGDLDIVSMAVRPMMILQNGAEFPLGVFRWADDNALQRSWGIDRETSMVDRSTILDQQVPRAIGFRAGTNPVSAAAALAREVLPPEQVQAGGNAVLLSAPMAWAPGSQRVTIMGELLAQAGFVPPYLDRNGICQLQPAPDPLAGSDPVVWPLGAPVEAMSPSLTNTLLDTPNLFVVYDSSGQGGGIRGIYAVPASAPHSFARRGYNVPLVRGVSGLASQAVANAQAYAMSISDGRTWEYQSFVGAANPLHDAWTTVEYRSDRWLETRHELVLRNGGRHSHLLRRTYGQFEDG